MLKDKEPEKIIKNIAGEDFVERFIAAPVNSPRAETPENLRDIAAKYGANADAGNNMREVLAQAMSEARRDNLAVVCFGSLYLAGDVKRAYESL
jgi:folylpolyglutamate synthase/dihydropteroate synthase